MKKLIPLFSIFLFTCSTCFAWGSYGHRIVGTVALHYLTPNIKDSIQVYLGKSPLEDATTWMDEVVSDPAYADLKTLHYINIERGQKYDSLSQGNIISELNKVIGELKERNKYSKEHIAMDLKILCHLMGDLHQPLHVG